MYNVFDIANWFLAENKNVTHKKLQKLAYYAYSWYLVFNNEDALNITNRFFPNNFQAWIHGAVDPSLYSAYKPYGSSYIPCYDGILPAFTYDELDVLNQVNEVYGGFSGNELESICHQEQPWLNARGDVPPYEPSSNPILDSDIFQCYAGRLGA